MFSNFDLQNAPPKSCKYWIWEFLLSICYWFNAAGSNLVGFWLSRTRFFIHFGLLLPLFVSRLSAVFANNCQMNRMHSFLHWHTIVAVTWISFHWHLVRRAAHRASAASRRECTACWMNGHLHNFPKNEHNINCKRKWKEYLKGFPQIQNLKFEACWAPPIL